jgi:peptidoglycan hydrolase-like protein with peptidoglycan-binding domain
MHGLDCYVGDDVVSIPSAVSKPVTYTDAKTVTAVQAALVKKGYDCGSTGPNGDGVDGAYGSNTSNAIKKFQAALNWPQTGKIDPGICAQLGVTPGKLPPGVTMAERAAVQSQIALDNATAAEHAATPSDVQAVATNTQAVADAAAPPPPPDVQAQVKDATAKAKAAKTPADVKAAAQDLQAANQALHEVVKPSWVVSPAWPGGPAWWQVGVAVGGALALGGLAIAGVKRLG